MRPALAATLLLAAAAALAGVAAKKETCGCPIAGLSAICPAYTKKTVPRKLAAAGIERRSYAPSVFAFIRVNASTFGTASASTGPALDAYTGGANEAGFKFHDTAPRLLRFSPSRDLATFGRAFIASRFLDVAEVADAPAPTANAGIRACKARSGADAAFFVANWTSVSPLPGPPTGSTVLGHLARLASYLDRAGERYCARHAWLASYSPDTLVGGRKYYEVSLSAGRCREEGEEGKGAECGGEEAEAAEEVAADFEEGPAVLRLDAE